MSSSVRVVIVNWNTGPYLRRCLASLAAMDREDVELERVVIVDNGSTDGSATDLRFDSLPLEVVASEVNLGFGAACNRGAAGSSAPYLLFLNPDTEVEPDAIARVTRFMDGDASRDVGICGAQVVHGDGTPAISCARFPAPRVLLGKVTGLHHVAPGLFPSHHMPPAELDHSRPVDQVIGAFFFVRRALFERLGGFDARYFLYYEEVDFAVRARSAGAASYLLREARVLHAENVSSDQVQSARLYHSLLSRTLFAYRHWRRPRAHLLVLATCCVEMPLRIAGALVTRRPPAQIAEIVSAYRRYLSAVVRGLPAAASL